jgi:hypothetical protein
MERCKAAGQKATMSDVPPRWTENWNNGKAIPTLLGGNIGAKHTTGCAANGAGAPVLKCVPAIRARGHASKTQGENPPRSQSASYRSSQSQAGTRNSQQLLGGMFLGNKKANDVRRPTTFYRELGQRKCNPNTVFKAELEREIVVLLVNANTITCLRVLHVTRSPRSFAGLVPLISFAPDVELALGGEAASGMASAHKKVAAHCHEKTKSEDEKKTDPRTCIVKPYNIQSE